MPSNYDLGEGLTIWQQERAVSFIESHKNEYDIWRVDYYYDEYEPQIVHFIAVNNVDGFKNFDKYIHFTKQEEVQWRDYHILFLNRDEEIYKTNSIYGYVGKVLLAEKIETGVFKISTEETTETTTDETLLTDDSTTIDETTTTAEDPLFTEEPIIEEEPIVAEEPIFSDEPVIEGLEEDLSPIYITDDLIIFNGTFTIAGGRINVPVNCVFTVTWDVEQPKVKRFGYKEEDPDDISITGIFGTSGTITERHGPFVQPVPNAIITVWKNGFIYDKVKTNELGEYTVFLPNGVYNIEIDGHSFKRTIHEHKITDGISEVKCLPVSGDIFEKHYDVVSFLYEDPGTGIVGYYNDWLVNGEILDKKNKPVKDAEIVVSVEDEVVTYVKTDDEGQYHFMLPLGVYDVLIRLPKQHAKIAKGVHFGGREGFIPNVVQDIKAVR